jgi:hypothetical protein
MADFIKCRILIFRFEELEPEEYIKLYEEFRNKDIDEIVYIAFSNNNKMDYRIGTITFTKEENADLSKIKDEREIFNYKLKIARQKLVKIYSEGDNRDVIEYLLMRSLADFRNDLKAIKQKIFIYI